MTDLEFLRERAMAEMGPQTTLQLMGALSFAGPHLALESMGQTYQLLNGQGSRYRLPGTGLVTEGSLASVVALPWTNSPPAQGFDASLRVLALAIDQIPTAPAMDENGNRLPDTWELIFLGALGFDFWGDGDGDGFGEGEEYAAASDPTNPLSTPSGRPATPQNLSLIVDAQGNASVEWLGSLTAIYELWTSQNLDEWLPHPGIVESTPDGTHAVPIEINQPEGYFKVLTDISLP